MNPECPICGTKIIHVGGHVVCDCNRDPAKPLPTPDELARLVGTRHNASEALADDLAEVKAKLHDGRDDAAPIVSPELTTTEQRMAEIAGPRICDCGLEPLTGLCFCNRPFKHTPSAMGRPSEDAGPGQRVGQGAKRRKCNQIS